MQAHTSIPIMSVKCRLVNLPILQIVRYTSLLLSIADGQFGDLAGKYGKIKEDPFVIDITDAFISFDPKNKGYFLGRSVVIHAANGTRIACAKYLTTSEGG